MWFRFCCLFLLLLHSSRAAEIVGWRIPLSRYLEDNGRMEELVKLKSPPEASPFFHPGDELSQLPNVTKDGKLLADWIVWNATSGRLVVKGSLPAIRRVRNKIEAGKMSTHVRLSFGIYDYPANGAMPDEKAVPRYRQAFVVRSGQLMEYESKDENFTFNFNGEAYFEEVIGEELGRSAVYVRSSLDLTLKDQGRLQVFTPMDLEAGGSAWIAGDSDGQTGILVKLTAEPVLADGTPWREKLLWQRGGKTEPFVLDGGQTENRQIGDRWFSSRPLPGELFANLLPDDQRPPQVDPFAVTLEARVDYSIYPEIPVPAELSQWIDLPVRDVATVFRDAGVTLGEGDLVGYDPEQEMLFSYTKEKSPAELIEMLFTSTCNLRWQSAIAITLEDGGRTRLLCGGGRRATLERFSADGSVIRVLEIEPSIGESGDIIDSRLSLFDQRNPVAKGSLKTSVALRNGEFSEIWRDVSSGGQANAVRVKAEMPRR